MTRPDLSERLAHYVRDLFAEEDDVLVSLRAEMGRQGLPEINISADVGRLLQVLLRTVGARNVLEIGTLGGYSAIWMARALPAGGRLLSLERDEARAAFARRFIDRAGLAETIEVRVGNARSVIRELVEGGAASFDAAFIDADKESYVQYLEGALALVRPGGLILADNAFRDGRVLDEEPDEATRGILAYTERVASDPRLVSTIIPIRDGVVVSLVSPAESDARGR